MSLRNIWAPRNFPDIVFERHFCSKPQKNVPQLLDVFHPAKQSKHKALNCYPRPFVGLERVLDLYLCGIHSTNLYVEIETNICA